MAGDRAPTAASRRRRGGGRQRQQQPRQNEPGRPLARGGDWQHHVRIIGPRRPARDATAGKGFPPHMQRRQLRSAPPRRSSRWARVGCGCPPERVSNSPRRQPSVRSPATPRGRKTPLKRRREPLREEADLLRVRRPGCGDCRRMQALLYPVRLRGAADRYGSRAAGHRLGRRQTAGGTVRNPRSPRRVITTPEAGSCFSSRLQGRADFYGHVRKDLDDYRKFAQRIEGQEGRDAVGRGSPRDGPRALCAPRHRGRAPASQARQRGAQSQTGVRESALEGLAAAELQLGQTAGDARQSTS